MNPYTKTIELVKAHSESSKVDFWPISRENCSLDGDIVVIQDKDRV